ncbi:hypothetical protein AQJ23_40705 [Streptomyces antibioticus]|nr:hypothetical protein [Streptomyces antibioticus]KUN17763.1 hypothetical protein AQJ23_40705 [Streptomyces antibioticus]
MSPFSVSVVLLVDDDYIPIEAEFGELMPAEVPQWGGLLRGVPLRLAGALRPGRQTWLIWLDGREHGVRLGGQPQMDGEGRLIVAFLGEGAPPAR